MTARADVNRALGALHDSIERHAAELVDHVEECNDLHESESPASDSFAPQYRLRNDDWDYYGRPHRWPSPHHSRTDAGISGGSGLYRSRSQGTSQAPTINVYNRMFEDREYSPYAPYPPSTDPRSPSRPRASHKRHWRGRSRSGDKLGDELADELAEMALEHRYRSRGRAQGRSDASAFDHPPAPPAGVVEWHLAKRKAVPPRQESAFTADSSKSTEDLASGPFEEIDRLLHRWTTVEDYDTL